MEWKCGMTAEEKRDRRIAAKKEWHAWFAWLPVRVEMHDCYWLQFVERRGEYHGVGPGEARRGHWEWEYRRYPVGIV